MQFLDRDDSGTHTLPALTRRPGWAVAGDLSGRPGWAGDLSGREEGSYFQARLPTVTAAVIPWPGSWPLVPVAMG